MLPLHQQGIKKMYSVGLAYDIVGGIDVLYL